MPDTAQSPSEEEVEEEEEEEEAESEDSESDSGSGNMSRAVRKLAFYMCENKDADQLRGNREADQRLCFRNTDSTIPLLAKSKISSLSPSSVAIQLGLCGTRSKSRRPVFSQRGSYSVPLSIHRRIHVCEVLGQVRVQPLCSAEVHKLP